MAFLTLGEAVDRVLARLADQREGKTGEVISLAGKVARADRADYPARGEEIGCGRGEASASTALRQRERAKRAARFAGHPMAGLD